MSRFSTALTLISKMGGYKIIPQHKKKKIGACHHHRRRTYCLDCKREGIGGGAICDEHLKRRDQCLECYKHTLSVTGVTTNHFFCHHFHQKAQCRVCSPGKYCSHKKRATFCTDCFKEGKRPAGLCTHGRVCSRCCICTAIPRDFFSPTK